MIIDRAESGGCVVGVRRAFNPDFRCKYCGRPAVLMIDPDNLLCEKCASPGIGKDGIGLVSGIRIAPRAALNSINLSNKDLSGANLSDAVLKGCDFSGADLRGANLLSAAAERCNFSGADLRGAKLFCAILRNCNFSGADLSGANLESADFHESNLDCAVLDEVNAKDAQFCSVSLDSTSFLDANLAESAFSRCDNIRDATFKGACLADAIIRDCNFTGVDLSEANLRFSKIRSTLFEDSDLKSAQLGGAQIEESRMRRVRLDNVDFDLDQEAKLLSVLMRGKSRCWLSNVEMYNSSLNGANISFVEFHHVTFSFVSAKGAIFSNTYINSAGFTRCDLSGVKVYKSYFDDLYISDTDLKNSLFYSTFFYFARLVEDKSPLDNPLSGASASECLMPLRFLAQLEAGGCDIEGCLGLENLTSATRYFIDFLDNSGLEGLHPRLTPELYDSLKRSSDYVQTDKDGMYEVFEGGGDVSEVIKINTAVKNKIEALDRYASDQAGLGVRNRDAQGAAIVRALNALYEDPEATEKILELAYNTIDECLNIIPHHT